MLYLPLFLTASGEILPTGWGIVIKHGSFIFSPRAISFARSSKGSVNTVKVGIPSLSKFSWSTTNHVVQPPQSPWDATHISGLNFDKLAAISLLASLFVPEFLDSGKTSQAFTSLTLFIF